MNWIRVNVNGGELGSITVIPSNDKESFELKVKHEINDDSTTFYLDRDELSELKAKLEVLLDFTR